MIGLGLSEELQYMLSKDTQQSKLKGNFLMKNNNFIELKIDSQSVKGKRLIIRHIILQHDIYVSIVLLAQGL